MSNNLVPEYFDKTFDIIKSDFIDILNNDQVFKDYLTNGENLTILAELVSYAGSISTFYMNKIAKNHYIDTSDIYETTHMLSNLKGYEPKGYISSNTILTISIGPSAGVDLYDTIIIPAWMEIECDGATTPDGETIKFSTITTTTVTVSSSPTSGSPFEFQIPVRQGEVKTYSYTGSDLVDNKLYLPSLQFDYDNDIYDDYPSIELQIENEKWTRVDNFYNETTGLINELKSYMLKYDKYKTYVIEFMDVLGVPRITDKISIKILETFGEDGNVEANVIKNPIEEDFIYNITTLEYLDNGENDDPDYVIITHNAATGGLNPETITNIKDNSSGTFHSQFRNVTALDYIKFLEQRNDVIAANVWGEMEENILGNTDDYNKVYISVIPDVWGTGTITVSGSTPYDIIVPTLYSDDYKNELSSYISARKILSTYESYILPEILNFVFKIGIKIKSSYSFSAVEADVKNKLNYYFNTYNRSFHETIKITDIIDYILDINNISEDETFSNVKGIQYLLIRDINIFDTTISEPDSENILWSWGRNEYGQLGNNDSNWIDVYSPVLVYNNQSFDKIVMGINSTYGLKDDGTLWAWGKNDSGQLGDGTIIDKISPTSVLGGISFKNIFCDNKTVFGIRGSDDSAWSWGRNSYGQLGDGTRTHRSSPVSVKGYIKFKEIIINGNNNVIGIDKSHLAWGWGRNDYGQLGDGSRASKSSPVPVLGGINFKQIVVEDNYTYGLDNDLSVWSWGENTYGQLGTGNVTSYSSPTLVIGGISFKEINSLGGIENSTGNLWCWGRNNYGQLGDNSRTDRSSPVSVKGNISFSKFVTDNISCLAINGLNNTGWSWGNNLYGQLGTGNITSYSSPASILGGISFTDIKLGISYNSGGIRVSDTSLWVWGYNNYGQLGVNSINPVSSPIGIAEFTGIVDFILGSDSTTALKNTTTDFPKYIDNSSTYSGDNKLRDIELGYNQFPQIIIDNCVFTEER